MPITCRLIHQEDQCRSKQDLHQRALRSYLTLVAHLFGFLVLIESVAFIVLGVWHLIIPRLEIVLSFSIDIYRRELTFGILLVVIGSLGILMSIFGLVAFYTLHFILLRIFEFCLWFLMIIGASIGIIGIIFASQVDEFIRQSTNANRTSSTYTEEKLMLGMNGALTSFMSLTLIIGIAIVRCLEDDVRSHSNDQ